MLVKGRLRILTPRILDYLGRFERVGLTAYVMSFTQLDIYATRLAQVLKILSQPTSLESIGISVYIKLSDYQIMDQIYLDQKLEDLRSATTTEGVEAGKSAKQRELGYGLEAAALLKGKASHSKLHQKQVSGALIEMQIRTSTGLMSLQEAVQQKPCTDRGAHRWVEQRGILREY